MLHSQPGLEILCPSVVHQRHVDAGLFGTFPERVLLWLEDIEQAETSDPDWQRRRTSSSAQAPKPAATAAAGSSTTAPRRTSTATRRTAREADSRPAGFSLGSLFGCFGKGRTRD